MKTRGIKSKLFNVMIQQGNFISIFFKSPSSRLVDFLAFCGICLRFKNSKMEMS